MYFFGRIILIHNSTQNSAQFHVNPHKMPGLPMAIERVLGSLTVVDAQALAWQLVSGSVNNRKMNPRNWTGQNRIFKMVKPCNMSKRLFPNKLSNSPQPPAPEATLGNSPPAFGMGLWDLYPNPLNAKLMGVNGKQFSTNHHQMTQFWQAFYMLTLPTSTSFICFVVPLHTTLASQAHFRSLVRPPICFDPRRFWWPKKGKTGLPHQVSRSNTRPGCSSNLSYMIHMGVLYSIPNILVSRPLALRVFNPDQASASTVGGNVWNAKCTTGILPSKRLKQIETPKHWKSFHKPNMTHFSKNWLASRQSFRQVKRLWQMKLDSPGSLFFTTPFGVCFDRSLAVPYSKKGKHKPLICHFHLTWSTSGSFFVHFCCFGQKKCRKNMQKYESRTPEFNFNCF